MRHRSLFLFLLLQLLVITAAAQDFQLKQFDINNGLSNNSVVSIFQDREGFMWFGTYDGLNRFDGYNFKVYRNNITDSTSLVSNTVYCIAEDSKNYLWTGGARGACRLNRATDAFEKVYYTSGKNNLKQLVKGEIHQIRTTANGGVLVASKDSGLLYYKSHSDVAAQIPLVYKGATLYDYDAVAVEYVSEKKCWVAVRNYGVCRFDAAKMSLSLVYPYEQRIHCLLYDKQNGNRLWLGTGSGAYELNLDTFALSENRMEGRKTVFSILRDKAGVTWLATDGHGVYTVQKNAARAVPFSQSGKKFASKSNSFVSIYQDQQSNLWFGTLRAGINLLGHDPQRFTHILTGPDTDAVSPDNFILSFCEADNNGVWVGTDGAGLKYWDRSKNTFTQVNGLNSNFITGMTRGNGNDLWVSMWYGDVNRLDTKTGAITRFECFNPFTRQQERNTWLVFKDKDNRIWVSATNEGTLYCFNEQKQEFEVFNKDIRNLQCLTQTRDGILWGGDYNALYGINIKTKAFKKYELGYPVRSVKQDTEGNLWVGTQEGGLLLFDTKTGTYKRYTTTDGLPGNTVLRILEDKKGNLWISTYNGLSRFDRRKTFRNFSISDGLQSNQFSFNAALQLSGGEMLFGGINGFNIFRPESVTTVRHTENLRLSSIWLNNNPLNDANLKVTQAKGNTLRHIRLPYDQTALSFDFVSLDFLHPDKIKYAYKLDGWDDHWIYADNQRKANYNHITEGDYTFMVKTLSSDGTWNAPETLATLRVMPPWYRTWWSYILYGLLATGAIVAWLRYNRYKIEMAHKVELAQLERRQEKQMAERQVEMFTYITHEFRTPLSLIINPLRQASKKSGAPEGLDKELGVAHRNARRLLSLVDQLLLFRKAESDADELAVTLIDVKHLCKEVYECFVNLASEQGIAFLLEMPQEHVEIYGDYEKIEIALFNIASNAFKYTPPKGRISINVVNNDIDVAISITDSGTGIAADELPHIFNKFRRAGSKVAGKSGFGVGLFITKYFVEKHHATITCQSQKGRGTTFNLSFLKGYAHFADVPVNAVVLKKSELVEELIGHDDYVSAEEDKAVIEKEIITEKKSVLIVEDNAEMREYLHGLFAESSIVYTADNGLEGFNLAEKHLPDIIISDISMEGMDGLELCRKIKSSKGLGHLPVILLTATSSQEVQLQGISEGADDFITKPFNSDILIAKVERLLKSRGNLKSYFLDSITLKDSGNKVPAEYREFLNKCIEIIEANFGNPDFNLKFFALEMGMSHRSLYDKIKQISGQTLNAFIRSVRLRKAALLMLTENKNINQISQQVGFEDQRYFREQFVKLFGMTPSEYIKRYKHNFNKELNVIKDEE
jgi:signal transduction histidine kinase/ligand-binding sensor domain-containing protein/CheY-like chemotaxis protein/AraC-like DNA-binding protein